MFNKVGEFHAEVYIFRVSGMKKLMLGAALAASFLSLVSVQAVVIVNNLPGPIVAVQGTGDKAKILYIFGQRHDQNQSPRGTNNFNAINMGKDSGSKERPRTTAQAKTTWTDKTKDYFDDVTDIEIFPLVFTTPGGLFSRMKAQVVLDSITAEPFSTVKAFAQVANADALIASKRFGKKLQDDAGISTSGDAIPTWELPPNPISFARNRYKAFSYSIKIAAKDFPRDTSAASTDPNPGTISLDIYDGMYFLKRLTCNARYLKTPSGKSTSFYVAPMTIVDRSPLSEASAGNSADVPSGLLSMAPIDYVK
jgi:hypothetical protein